MEGLIGLIITVPIGIVVGAATIGLGIKWGKLQCAKTYKNLLKLAKI